MNYSWLSGVFDENNNFRAAPNYNSNASETCYRVPLQDLGVARTLYMYFPIFSHQEMKTVST